MGLSCVFKKVVKASVCACYLPLPTGYVVLPILQLSVSSSVLPLLQWCCIVSLLCSASQNTLDLIQKDQKLLRGHQRKITYQFQHSYWNNSSLHILLSQNWIQMLIDTCRVRCTYLFACLWVQRVLVVSII